MEDAEAGEGADLTWKEALVNAVGADERAEGKWKSAGNMAQSHFQTLEAMKDAREEIVATIISALSQADQDVLTAVKALGNKKRGVEESEEKRATRKKKEDIDGKVRKYYSLMLAYAFPEETKKTTPDPQRKVSDGSLSVEHSGSGRKTPCPEDTPVESVETLVDRLPSRFTISLASKRRSGKTYLVRELLETLLNKQYQPDDKKKIKNPDQVIVMSNSAVLNDDYDFLADPARPFNEEALASVRASQMSLTEANRLTGSDVGHVLVVLPFGHSVGHRLDHTTS